jgi:uncharacterized protein
LASDHGLTPTIAVTGTHHKLLAQVNQSDLAFLRGRARAIGAEIWIDGTDLHVASRTLRQGNQLTLAYGRDLREFSVAADLAGQASATVASGWDSAAKSAIREQAGVELLGGETLGDDSGASILEQSFSSRTQTLAHCFPNNNEEAKALARAHFLEHARRFVVGRGLADSDPALRVGTWVTLQGLGALFNGKYYVTETRIRFDTGGLRTEFVAERAGLGKATP